MPNYSYGVQNCMDCAKVNHRRYNQCKHLVQVLSYVENNSPHQPGLQESNWQFLNLRSATLSLKDLLRASTVTIKGMHSIKAACCFIFF